MDSFCYADDEKEDDFDSESEHESENSSNSDYDDVQKDDLPTIFEEEDDFNDLKYNDDSFKKGEYIGQKFLTKFEKARVIGVRVEQIIAGAKVFVDVPGVKDPLLLAMEELKQKKMPLLIRRYFNNKYKDISVNDLEVLLE